MEDWEKQHFSGASADEPHLVRRPVKDDEPSPFQSGVDKMLESEERLAATQLLKDQISHLRKEINHKDRLIAELRGRVAELVDQHVQLNRAPQIVVAAAAPDATQTGHCRGCRWAGAEGH